ncbi:MAG: amidohydrolase family protein [Kiritimatiellia bacterium]
MIHNDFHIHCFGGSDLSVSAASFLKTMDRSKIARAAVLSEYGDNLDEQKVNIIRTGKFIAEAPDRLYGMAWVEPRHKTPLEVLDWAVEKYRYRGFKMIPNRWYPCEERVLKYCRRMAGLGAPCLFHSGILYFKTISSRFCRPAYYEALLEVPRFRFALAHISWPWTDECLALFGQARAAKHAGYSTAEMFIDVTPGTPPDYRENALRHLLNFGAEDHMIYGSDQTLATLAENAPRAMKREISLYRRMKIPAAARENILSRNFERFFA